MGLYTLAKNDPRMRCMKIYLIETSLATTTHVRYGKRSATLTTDGDQRVPWRPVSVNLNTVHTLNNTIRHTILRVAAYVRRRSRLYKDRALLPNLDEGRDSPLFYFLLFLALNQVTTTLFYYIGNSRNHLQTRISPPCCRIKCQAAALQGKSQDLCNPDLSLLHGVCKNFHTTAQVRLRN